MTHTNAWSNVFDGLSSVVTDIMVCAMLIQHGEKADTHLEAALRAQEVLAEFLARGQTEEHRRNWFVEMDRRIDDLNSRRADKPAFPHLADAFKRMATTDLSDRREATGIHGLTQEIYPLLVHIHLAIVGEIHAATRPLKALLR